MRLSPLAAEALAWDRHAPPREMPETPLTDADRAERSLTSDLLCPITLEVLDGQP